MSYTRKTEDEYQLHVNYGHGDGWEHETTEATMKAAREQKKVYAEECPQYATKIVKRRVRKVAA